MFWPKPIHVYQIPTCQLLLLRVDRTPRQPSPHNQKEKLNTDDEVWHICGGRWPFGLKPISTSLLDSGNILSYQNPAWTTRLMAYIAAGTTSPLLPGSGRRCSIPWT